MYERSAIVLERHIEKILNFDGKYNLRDNYENFKGLIDEIEKYQILANQESRVIKEFDNTVREIENIQKEQEKLYKLNLKLEEDRNKLFNDLDEEPQVLEGKFEKIETNLSKNNEQLKNLSSEFTKYLNDFNQRQKERSKCEKAKRLGEANYIEYVKKSIESFNSIDPEDVLKLKEFVTSKENTGEQEIIDAMTKNGRNEKIEFDHEVLQLAVSTRIDIAKREAECYVLGYDRMKKLLAEVDSDNIGIKKYEKVLRDLSTKLTFLNTEKEYLVGFLDYERMTAISGTKAHRKIMEQACKNFEADVKQINNLYYLILREIANKHTKKAYKELYNATYLQGIEAKEKNFEEEINNININMATVINPNYWRIEGICNIYEVFQNEVTQKFGVDLSEFEPEEKKFDIDDDLEINDDEEEEKETQNKHKQEDDDIEIDDEDEYDQLDEEDSQYFEQDDDDFDDDDFDAEENEEEDNKGNEDDKDEDDEEIEDDFDYDDFDYDDDDDEEDDFEEDDDDEDNEENEDEYEDEDNDDDDEEDNDDDEEVAKTAETKENANEKEPKSLLDRLFKSRK